MKSIVSTGENLMEDVTQQFTCWECEGSGYFRGPTLEDEDRKCLECHGTGLNV